MTDKPDTQELAIYAAVEIMGKRYSMDNSIPYICDDDEDGNNLIDNWRPAEDANQLDLIEAELVKLGFEFEEKLDKFNYRVYIQFWISGDLDNSFYVEKFGTQEGKKLTRLTAMCQAFDKYKKING